MDCALCRIGILGTVFPQIREVPMDFETFFQSLFSLLKSGDNVYYVLYASATCILTQIFKKIFVNKVKVDVLHKFDFAVILPFLLGAVFAAVDLICVRNVAFSLDFVTKFVVGATTIGALATVIFKFFSSLSGQSLKSLLKDDVFGAFYTQLLYFGKIRELLLNKEISLKDFVAQVKMLSSNALEIYKSDEPCEVKRDRLTKMLTGIVDGESISACAEVLNKALIAVTESKSKTEK